MSLQFQKEQFFGRGTRKASVAAAWVTKGKGSIFIRVNSKNVALNDYFKSVQMEIDKILKPLVLLKIESQYDIICRVNGGGLNGQADAVSLSIAKALSKIDSNFRETLRFYGLLTTDARKVESKKPGQLKARKSTTFNRR